MYIFKYYNLEAYFLCAIILKQAYFSYLRINNNYFKLHFLNFFIFRVP